MLTQQRLKELFKYCSHTGTFTRIKRTSSRAKMGEVKGEKTKNGYLHTMIDKKYYYHHRLAVLYMTGEFPKNQTDHINGVRDDNRWINLRRVTAQENRKNISIGRRNKTGVLGVSWNKVRNKWFVSIGDQGKQKTLGETKDFFEAICLRKSAENERGYHPNHGKML